MAKLKITEFATDLLKDFLLENELELYNIEYVKEGRDWFLKVYIENTEEKYHIGISSDQCAMVSNYLSEKLDEHDPISQNYFLEVSSPGMDRILFREKDYIRFTGNPVIITLYKPIDGPKTINGILDGIEDEMIIVTNEKGDQFKLKKEEIAKTKLEVVF